MTTTTAAFTDARRELRSLTAGLAYLVYDLVGVAMAAALAVVLIVSSARTTRQLYALERI